jgi:hypothetical protein
MPAVHPLRLSKVPEARCHETQDGQGSDHYRQASNVRCPGVARAAAHALCRRASLVSKNAAATTMANNPRLRAL